MARAKQTENVYRENAPKRTTIGRGKIKTSSMNKHKRRTYKAYNAQGKYWQFLEQVNEWDLLT